MRREPETGIEELRILVNIAGHTNEDAFDGFSVEETVRLLQACRALDLETLPDMLTSGERQYAAKQGEVSTACLRRLYKQEGLEEKGPDWDAREEKKP